mmetsp:Transcript_11357/g.31688  ORF Transcript_11357/g.31688 Transcript_11357/m.31688 type:complete len:130 (-) Transcript_11357:356-745(-)
MTVDSVVSCFVFDCQIIEPVIALSNNRACDVNQYRNRQYSSRNTVTRVRAQATVVFGLVQHCDSSSFHHIVQAASRGKDFKSVIGLLVRFGYVHMCLKRNRCACFEILRVGVVAPHLGNAHSWARSLAF